MLTVSVSLLHPRPCFSNLPYFPPPIGRAVQRGRAKHGNRVLEEVVDGVESVESVGWTMKGSRSKSSAAADDALRWGMHGANKRTHSFDLFSDFFSYFYPFINKQFV